MLDVQKVSQAITRSERGDEHSYALRTWAQGMITSTKFLPKGGKAVCLVSGGLDSTVVLTLAVKNHNPENIIPICFDYGQTHLKEMTHARRICDSFEILFFVTSLYGLEEADSALTGSDEYDQARKTRATEEQGLPPSFVPGRNIAMLAIAASIAYSRGAKYIYGGWNAIDYSGYPDCRLDFLWRMESAISSGLGSPVEIVAPLITLKKAEIIHLGVEHNAPLRLTWSCYKGEAEPCGICDSCEIRAKGFAEANLKDPAI